MKRIDCLVLPACVLLAACAPLPPADNAALTKQVTATERAFAQTMARRDFAAFQTFLSEEAVFDGGREPLRGKAAVAAAWKAYFEGAQAPFSWEPDRVAVLASGTLAQSGGPVRDPQGKVMARFNSIWRQEAPGQWRVVFDKGEPVCDCKAEKP
ncbi:YybH family protein [Pseudoduganella chitinolytica]|uniref:Nuclear transport factor 2 family protein n=1 Tax=Pseudoduganella chitinolytica TaxID=34070 RepID=A0ABY8BFN7_9BURK|nr:nuclear transport factor 2 family protein [Pseudoduganella chitinolytica]WEF34722.1 nuclear transport factor 2 family protein [Pseudoduganella chitinolytica]